MDNGGKKVQTFVNDVVITGWSGRSPFFTKLACTKAFQHFREGFWHQRGRIMEDHQEHLTHNFNCWARILSGVDTRGVEVYISSIPSPGSSFQFR